MTDGSDTPPLRRARAIAAYGSGGDRSTLRAEEDDWARLVPILSSERLAGIALAAAAAGDLAIPDPTLDRLMDLHRDAMMWALTLERAFKHVLESLRGDGIEPVLLKGPAIARTRYPDPSWRPFSDLDILVRDTDRARASACLATVGYPASRPAPRKGFDDRFGKAVVHRSTSGVEIDLHRTLAQGPFVRWIDPGILIDRAMPIRVAGETTRRLDDTGLFLHACVHAALGGRKPTLLMLRDVVQCWSAPSIDWTLVASLTQAWRLGAVVRYACVQASLCLAVPLPLVVREQLAVRPRREDMRVLRAYTGPRRHRGGTELAMLAALPGVRDRTAYAGSLLVPSRDFLRARALAQGGSASYAHRWRNVARSFTRRGGE